MMHRQLALFIFGLVFVSSGICLRTKKKMETSKRAQIDLCKIDAKVFTCGDGECVLQDWYCDGDPDCVDGTDEPELCVCNPRTRFVCADGSCKPLSYKCDGTEDCADGSDESDCPETQDLVCSDGTILPDGLIGRCDNYFDCYDESDEDNCEDYTCDTRIQTTCNDGTCLPLFYLCDETVDCAGGEDEEDCD